ncbi:MAG: hypothetical protein U9Q68_10025 [Euryarchaeota archaeon]|nr:hypothetical protein [Euryarchaeota archaeon]
MKKAYKIYTEAIRDHFKVFYANWPIGERRDSRACQADRGRIGGAVV